MVGFLSWVHWPGNIDGGESFSKTDHSNLVIKTCAMCPSQHGFNKYLPAAFYAPDPSNGQREPVFLLLTYVRGHNTHRKQGKFRKLLDLYENKEGSRGAGVW